MSAQTIQHAAKLNEEASSLLLNGDSNAALAQYKEALKILRSTLQDEDEVVANTELSDSALNVYKVPIRLRALPLPEEQWENQKFIYRMLICYGEPLPRETGTCAKLLSAVVVFNLSFLYQIEEMDRCTCILQSSSARLYEMCLNLLNTEARHCRERAILRAICFNNMAHIAYDHEEYTTTEILLQSLVQCLTNEAGPDVFFDPKEMQAFAFNCLLVRGAPTVAKAA
jgi:hypothetical protein